MFKNLGKDSFKFTIKNLIKLILVLGMNLSLIMISLVMPLWVINSKILFNISIIFVLPLVLCCFSTYVASLMRENDSIYNSFLLFENRYVRNIVVMLVILTGMFVGPFVIINKDIMNENVQIPVIVITSLISFVFMIKFRYMHLVLAENPNMSVIRIFRKNKEVMKGNTFKRLISSLLLAAIPAIITFILNNKLYEQINPIIILSVGGVLTYIFKEVVDLKIYRSICGHVYLQFDEIKTLNSASNSNNMDVIPKKTEVIVQNDNEEYDQYLSKQLASDKYNQNLKYVQKYVK